ncbi:hypothetical protein [Paraburkholderia atlantica]|uniref:hypothetical protein n=1 Tax=Paraburkholderia atlantica TaxID=2654982 RepID=UPI003D243455
MSLEAALAENTATMKELIAALLSVGAVQTAQVSSAAHSSPAVKAVVKAQKDADAKDTAAKKQQTQEAATPAADAGDAPTASGEPSASTGESSSDAPTLRDWHEKTADKYAELKDAEPNLENVRKAILGINSLIGRAQADAVLARFGAQAVTSKADKKGLDEVQYADFLKLCLRVLAGEVDATESIPAE